ncbi:MAG: ABC transporter permease [Butyrivibrio sp.]
MKGFRTIISKELSRVLKDKKMIFSMFVLPIILVIGIMGLIGILISNIQTDIEEHVSVIYLMDAPEDFYNIVKNEKGYDINQLQDKEVDAVKQDIMDGNVDLLIEFPKDFTEQVYNKDEVKVPQVKTYYNPSEDYSSAARDNFLVNLEEYRQKLLAEKFGSVEYTMIFTVDSDNEESVIQDDEKAFGKMLGMMVPYFITMLIFASAMGLGIDSIAGEKERGTLASLLLTPVKRAEIVLGKVISLAILSIMSALVYVISMLVVAGVGLGSLGGGEIASELAFSFTPLQALQLVVMIIGIVLMYVSIIGLVAVLAKNIKEAQAYISPVYIIVLVAGMITMYTTDNPSFGKYLIPLFGASTAFKGIFTRTITAPEFLGAALVTYGVAVALIGITAKAFKSEKIMFNA